VASSVGNCCRYTPRLKLLGFMITDNFCSFTKHVLIKFPNFSLVFPAEAFIFIKPPEVYRQAWSEYCGTIGSTACACRLYLTVLSCVYFVSIETEVAHHRQTTISPTFSLTNIRAPIDRLISRESSPSPDLIFDRAAYPVCDHKRS